MNWPTSAVCASVDPCLPPSPRESRKLGRTESRGPTGSFPPARPGPPFRNASLTTNLEHPTSASPSNRREPGCGPNYAFRGSSSSWFPNPFSFNSFQKAPEFFIHSPFPRPSNSFCAKYLQVALDRRYQNGIMDRERRTQLLSSLPVFCYVLSFQTAAHSLKNSISRKPFRICALRTLLQNSRG